MAIACYVHPTLPTVAQCADCTRGLCTHCETLTRPPLCVECMEARAVAVVRAIDRRLRNAIVLAIVGAGLGVWSWTIQVPHVLGPWTVDVERTPFWLPYALAYLFGGGVYGNYMLSKRNRRFQFLMTLSTMVTLGLATTILGAIVGLFVSPFAIAADMKLKRAQQLLASAVRRSLVVQEPGVILSAHVR